jgi:hypothetical protein
VARDGHHPHPIGEDAVLTAFTKKNPAKDPEALDEIFSCQFSILHKYV